MEGVSAKGTTTRRWTASNLMSLARLVMALPAALLLALDLRWEVFALCLVASATDVLDGYLARRNGEISEFGKLLDPLADKIFVGVVVVVLLLLGELPAWFVAIVLGRDLLIMAGGILVERRTGVLLPSNYPGKVAVVSLSLTLLLIIVHVEGIVIDLLMGISLLLLAISLTLYAIRAFRLLARGERAGSITTDKTTTHGPVR